MATIRDLSLLLAALNDTDEWVISRTGDATDPDKRVKLSTLRSYATQQVAEDLLTLSATTAAARAAGDDELDDRIDNLVLLAGGDPGPEVGDARAAINHATGSPPATLSEALELASQNVYHAKAYGTIGAGGDDTTVINAAITAASDAGGGKVLVPQGTYLVNQITHKNNVILQGEGMGRTIIQKVAGGTGAILVRADTVAVENMIVRDLTMINAVSGGVVDLYTSAKTVRNVFFERCHFKRTTDGGPVLKLGGGDTFGLQADNIHIDRCVLEGVSEATDSQIIRISPNSEVAEQNSKLWITNNTIINGTYGYRVETFGGSAPNLVFTGNHVYGQSICGAMFYHARGLRASHNYFHDIYAPPRDNNDNGAVWLDNTNDVAGVFTHNHIKNIEGNGIFVEDWNGGSISNNVIENCTVRTAGYDATTATGGVSTNVSYAGNGILVAGGARGVQITNNTIHTCGNSGICVARDMGPHNSGYLLDNLVIANNYIRDFTVAGIEFDTAFMNSGGDHRIIGNEFSGVGSEAAIYVRGTEGAGRIIILGNTLAESPYGMKFDSGTNYVIVANVMGGTTGAINLTTLNGVFANNFITGSLGTLGIGATARIYGNYNAPANSEQLVLEGDADIDGDIDVAGTATIAGAVDLASTLDVDGAVTLNSALNVTGNTTNSGFLRLTSASATPASNAITATCSHMRIVGTGNPSIHTIDGGVDGALLLLENFTSSTTVTILQKVGGTGNIWCGSDRVLDSRSDTMLLVYNNNLSAWLMLSHSSNN